MQQTVAVIGLGYVGLPLAVRAVEQGYTVIGFDTHQEKIAQINKQECPIEDSALDILLKKFPFEATNQPERLSEADIVLLCVPTPVDEMYHPDLNPVISAATLSATHLKPGALIVLESTVNPGVSEEVILPIFEKHGHQIGTDFFLAHCPERINPGDEKWNVTNIPRVVGSIDSRGLDKAVNFYRSIVDGEIRPMKSIREAEAVKIVENSFRDINIAFVNELARSFDVLGIDVKDVIQGAATKPFSFLPHYPSCGVGGHCIPVDPYYLIERAKKSGFDHRFLKIAREINNAMPAYSVELLQDLLNEIQLPLNGTTIGVLGLAYKANIDDLRESPALRIIESLKKHKAEVITYDPHLPTLSTESSLETFLEKSTALILATNHREFTENLTPELLKKHQIKVIIDGKNCLDKMAFLEAEILYKGIGR
ncbi:MAG: nucleotide sugar dehydrogenase [Candidatus Moranbacteria bacterium]|jgi:UDP-N-acetyl-D-glucosamine dehydrogenase|nr:nucleotide sugar dehydrogenase [Candidatus Moranbacteria bacterium]MBP9801467.1 nucleotide sugar dehydrogenase [Candidatus Moranbacteria bacterium]